MVAVVSAIPYIALQLKAVAASVTALIGGTGDAGGGTETALLVLLLIALFSVLFGTRHIDATEHHEGMVLAVAFESVVKLAAFLIVGVYVTYVMFDGFGDVLGQAAKLADGPPLTVQGGSAGHADWLLITALSGLAFLFLDRQFQVAVIENVDEAHLRTASWLLPGLPAGRSTCSCCRSPWPACCAASARATCSSSCCRWPRATNGWRWWPIWAACRRPRP